MLRIMSNSNRHYLRSLDTTVVLGRELGSRELALAPGGSLLVVPGGAFIVVFFVACCVVFHFVVCLFVCLTIM